MRIQSSRENISLFLSLCSSFTLLSTLPSSLLLFLTFLLELPQLPTTPLFVSSVLVEDVALVVSIVIDAICSVVVDIVNGAVVV